ncbi:MAG: DUF779 domain-containing protein [Flavobacterium sp.]|nr:DUF779 domain-containing protein [Candidatus Neoflavobacterium equi]
METAKRLTATPKAMQLIEELRQEHGDLMFYQAGGCCEGTQPMCFTKGGYYPRLNDVNIGQLLGFDFWIDRDLFQYWKNAQFELDVMDGYGTGGFSLEIPKGKTFKVNYRIFTPEELAQLEDTTAYKH